MASPKCDQPFQILVRTPDLRTQTLTLTLNQTISDVISTVFPSSPITKSIFLSFNGKPLRNHTLLSSLNLRPWSTLSSHLKSLGGGGDGGSTCAESRDCYLHMYSSSKPDPVDPHEQLLSKWSTCSLSSEPLHPPCVLDRLGHLFNKEPLVKALLSKSLPTAFRHIRGLKDMIAIKLCETDEEEDKSVKFQCPVTGVEFNGKSKFVALSKCGHVLSLKALKEIKSSSCLVCHTEFEDRYPDKIVINGTDDEVAQMREMMEKELVQRTVSKSSNKKKTKKKKVEEEKEEDVEKRKRFKATDVAPPHANKEVYASIFISSRKSEFKETYSCRSLPLGRN